MIISHSKCPSEIILKTAKKTLDSIVKNDTHFNLTLFARWMRVMVTHLSAKNDKACRDSFDQALAVIRLNPPGVCISFLAKGHRRIKRGSQTTGGYPEPEVEWLASKAIGNQKQFERYAFLFIKSL